MTIRILVGDMRQRLRELPDASVDSCVCDPPYHLTSIVKRFGAANAAPAKVGKTGAYARASKGFMGQTWDGGDVAFDPDTWTGVLRVLKPGAHLVAFSGTRTYHRMVCAIEDAGFEIRDQLAWCYGSGFPKSHDVSKGIDKMAGAERDVIGPNKFAHLNGAANANVYGAASRPDATAPATPEAAQWQGWGTALKPAQEPILAATKPVTVAQHFAIILHELTAIFAEIDLWLNSPVQDAARRFTDTLVKCEGEASIVLDSAKIRSLASIGIAPYAVQSFTFKPLVSLDSIRIKDASALSHVRPNGSADREQANSTHLGGAADILTRLMAMSTSVMVDDISANTVSSWLSISDAIFSEMNKFTIETATRLTTALKILNCSLRENTIGGIGGLSPNWSPICLARKPLVGTVAANVLAHGTGALNIDGCRIEADNRPLRIPGQKSGFADVGVSAGSKAAGATDLGRWPANIIHDGSEEVLAGFPDVKSGSLTPEQQVNGGWAGTVNCYGKAERGGTGSYEANEGSAARFFYCAKATTEERGEGNNHPTVKPVDLMRWLCRLVTPKGGTVLDPFMGSGSTMIAADAEQFNGIGCELSPEYAAIAETRIRAAAGMFAEVLAA